MTEYVTIAVADGKVVNTLIGTEDQCYAHAESIKQNPYPNMTQVIVIAQHDDFNEVIFKWEAGE